MHDCSIFLCGYLKIYIYINTEFVNIYINININIYILSGNKYKYLVQTNILLGNVMTNSMQTTLSKAVIYTKQPTRE